MWVILSSLFVALLYITAALFSWRAAATARTPQGSVAWVVFLLALPFFAVPLYLYFGDHRFHGYRVARRESKQVIAAIREHAAEYAPLPDSSPVNFAPFEYCAHLKVLRGSDARLLVDGSETFDAIFAAIDAAQSYILVQFYIVRNDGLGRALQDRLRAAAQRGVRVRVLIDSVGSIRLPESWCETLRREGVEVIDRDATRGPRFRFQINFRNHRKTVIVDGKTGFTGGLNVGDEYLGKNKTFGRWRDTFVELNGLVVPQLQLIFAEDWHWATGETLADDLSWTTPTAARDANGLIVATGPGDLSETGSLLYFSAITAAKKRLWIATPYYVPDLDIVTALHHAALRGVDVRILVPDIIDHRIPWLAAFAYFDELRAAGVRVYRYTDGFMHQKAFVVDDTIASVGTMNLDNRSFRLNFETMAVFFDQKFAHDVAAMLERDFADSYELTLKLGEQPALTRYGAPLARLLSPLL
ncbi:cardiolipin synthase [Pontibaca salina]|uniref:Cardiolipin synthase n=1 Tax=Pontibaca salina TaxID=2795731 RepID=A0A934M2B5_9RHOB|nr:cardiolipin synthase [Pontibaca salina]MBI6630476.1 cardiolipin synthase [Pontibaca salina]